MKVDQEKVFWSSESFHITKLREMERIRMKPIVKTFQDKRRRLVTNQKLGNKGNHRLLKKPSIKITVSADVPSDLFSTKGIEGSPHVIKRILLDDSKYTRITVDNETVVDFPNCVDFGIRDFLCAYYEEEVIVIASSLKIYNFY